MLPRRKPPPQLLKPPRNLSCKLSLGSLVVSTNIDISETAAAVPETAAVTETPAEPKPAEETTEAKEVKEVKVFVFNVIP